MFISLIQDRRSIRKFIPRQVEKEKIEIIIEAALRSPSSMSRNPWEFIVVTEQGLLKKLAKAKPHGSTFLKDAPVGIVVLADPAKCDVWIEDASIASIFLHLAAESLGLGSCWIQIRDRMHNDDMAAKEFISQALGIPGEIQVESIVAIGYPDEKKDPHGKNELQYEKVYLNKYGQAFVSH